MTADIDRTLADVGPRLRTLRRERDMTMSQLAGATGISVSTLSRLESGQRRPTLDLLLPIAREYRVPLDELVAAPQTGDPRIHPRPVTRHGMVWVPLSREPGGLAAYKVVLPVPARPPRRITRRSHDGYDWMYVLAGKVRLALGDREFTLTAGEAAEFDTRTPHGFVNAGARAAELLTIFGRSGESVHVRARSR